MTAKLSYLRQFTFAFLLTGTFSMLSAMEQPGSIPDPFHHPMSRKGHIEYVTYWCANLSLLQSSIDYAKVGELLHKLEDSTNSQIDSLRITYLLKQNQKVPYDLLANAISHCRSEIDQENSNSELVTLLMRLMRFYALLGDREEAAKARGRIEALLGRMERFDRTMAQGTFVHIFSIVTDCYRLPSMIRMELSNPMFTPVDNPPKPGDVPLAAPYSPAASGSESIPSADAPATEEEHPPGDALDSGDSIPAEISEADPE